jgi:hypothetical protein
MAFLSGGIHFEGSLGDLSAYRMKGSDKIIIRHKGGPSKKMIKKHPKMVNTRRTMSEFGAASKASARIIRMIAHRMGWSMYGVQGELTARLMHLRRSDTVSEWGKRGILFSRNPQILEGFALSHGVTFDASVTSPLHVAISRDTLSAQIDIPELIQGVNLTLPEDRPQFRIVAELITVPDFIFAQEHNQIAPRPGYTHYDTTRVETDWYASRQGSPATTLRLNLDVVPPDQHFGLMLCIGIQLGVMHDSTTVELVRHVGTAKVLAMR